MSASKRNSFTQDLKLRETMFQFLKRQKSTNLPQSIRKQNIYVQQSPIKSQNKNIPYTNRSKSSNKNYSDLILQQESVPKPQHRIGINTSSITPKKISFITIDESYQSNNKRHYNTSRNGLLDMISPLKNRLSLNISNQVDTYSKSNKDIHSKSNKKGILKPTSKYSNKKDQQIFTKRKLTTTINTLKQNFRIMFQTGHSLKDKANVLSIAMINLVKDLYKDHSIKQSSLNQKFGQIKNILKAIISGLQFFQQSRDADNAIQQFQTSFNQHLQSIQIHNATSFKQQLETQINRVSSEKQLIIAQISSKNDKLQRQIAKYQRMIDKIQEQFENYRKVEQQRQQNLIQTIQELKSRNQKKVVQVESEIIRLKQKLQQQQYTNVQLQKQLKSLQYTQQQSISSHLSQISQKHIARESFLLQQINRLKQQFSSDITSLHNLNQTKLTQIEGKYNNLKKDMDLILTQRNMDSKVHDRILYNSNLGNKQLQNIKFKNQEMLKDLYRINQVLYQHWQALKDVKILTQRLSLYPTFQPIFRDLNFNNSLFRL